MTIMSNLAYRLERDVVIHAPPETVFGFFTDSPRWASWWGAGSTIDPRPGGRVQIRFPGGVEVAGEVLELERPTRMVFTYGFVSGDPIPAGSSRVTIRLDPHQLGTHLHLAHEFANEKARDEHVQGWRYHLALFSNVVTDELHADVASVVDAWFDAWAEGDEKKRGPALRRVADPGIAYRDRFSNTAGIDDLLPHVAATHRFMPGFRLRRVGNVRHCQGTALVDWVGVGADGQERGRGTSVFELGPTGKIRSVTGLWAR
ncbi:MAG TPA: SRPBCC domain-containing protein [Gemmatimonadaceae bacterium]|nr:SRPBCC domain-containing protein [Gemmatimonadaceae bacterium]